MKSTPVTFHAVYADMPHLLELYVLYSECLAAHTAINRLTKFTGVHGSLSRPTYAINDWHMPMCRIGT